MELQQKKMEIFLKALDTHGEVSTNGSQAAAKAAEAAAKASEAAGEASRAVGASVTASVTGIDTVVKAVMSMNGPATVHLTSFLLIVFRVLISRSALTFS